MSLPRYALVSPVRNEAKYIRHTLDSVVAQSHLPVKWVIVSDGSTDETDQIVNEYATRHPFVELVRREPDANRNFGSKVRAIETGVRALSGTSYDFIGNLDGDVSFAPDYFEKLLNDFADDPELGIGGGQLYDDHGGVLRKQMMSVNSSVAGPVQLFRRACYEQIGGYLPLPYGGVDAVAEGMARMHGWKVRTFIDLPVTHHRPVGTEGKGLLRARFDLGRRECVIGYHFAFAMGRAVSQMREFPFVVGGIWYAAGFVYARARRLPVAVPEDFVRFLRREQMDRLKGKRA